MLAVNVNNVETVGLYSPENPVVGCHVAFPVTSTSGSSSSSVIYFEVAPGGRLGRHTDSSEEVLYIVAGEAEAEIDGERGRVSQGGLVVVPAMAPHDVVNTGTETLRVIGFFSGATTVHRFTEPFFPGAHEAIFVNGPRGMEMVAGMQVPAPAPAG